MYEPLFTFDAKATLVGLLTAVRTLTPAKPEHDKFKLYHSMTADYRQQLDFAANASDSGVNSGKMIRAVRDFFPHDAIFSMDGGNTSLWCANYNPIYCPRSYLYTSKFGHLGTGIPYAIGAKLAAPDKPVYVISGDGAMGFNIAELETARRYNLPITVIVACDQGWGMERSSQIFAGLDELVECDLYDDTRYDKVAEAFGCHGEFVTEMDALQPALERAAAVSYTHLTLPTSDLV